MGATMETWAIIMEINKTSMDTFMRHQLSLVSLFFPKQLSTTISVRLLNWKVRLALENSGICKCFSVLFCFPTDLTGKAVENVCQFRDPAGLKDNVLSQEYQGHFGLWNVNRANFSVSPKTYCLLGATSTMMNPGRLLLARETLQTIPFKDCVLAQVKRMMEDYFPGSFPYTRTSVHNH